MNTHMSAIFSRRIQELTRNFVGRNWLFNMVDKFLKQGEKRCLIITGEPGIGKSAIAAKLIKKYDIKVHHFCIARHVSTLSPRSFIENLVHTLSRYIPGYTELITNIPYQTNIKVVQTVSKVKGQMTGVHIEKLEIGELSNLQAFEMLVLHPIQVLADKKRLDSLVLLVDALDEANSIRGETIVDILGYAQDLPETMHFILTSRYETNILRHFRDHLLVKSDNPENLADIRLYIKKEVAQSKAIQERFADARIDIEEFAERAIEASNGNFLYIVFLINNIAAGQQSITDLSDLPAGLDVIYREFLNTRIGQNTKRWRDQFRPLLGVLTVAKEPLAIDQLADFTGFSTQDIQDSLLDIGQFLNPTLVQEKHYDLYHQSLIDFLLDRDRSEQYWVEARYWHTRISNAYLNTFSKNWNDCDLYGLNYLLAHLQEAFLYDEMADLLNDLDFLENKRKRVNISALLEDMYYSYSTLKKDKRTKQASNITKALLKYLLSFGVINNKEFNIEHIHGSLFYKPDKSFAEEFLELGLDKHLIRQYIDKSIDISEALIAFREKLGELKRRNGDLEGAELQLNQLLEELKAHPYENANSLLARVEYNLGYVMFLRGDFDQAAQLLHQSAVDSFRGKNVIGGWISRCVEYRIRMLRALWQDEPDKIQVEALEEFEKTLNQALPHFQNESRVNLHAERWVMNVHAHFFEISYLKEDTSGAEKYLMALRENEWVNRYGGKLFLKPYLARFSILKGDWKKAVKYFKEYFQYFSESTGMDEIRKREAITRNYYDYGKALKGLGEKEKALIIWHKAISYPDEFGNHIWKKKIEKEIALLSVLNKENKV